MEIYSQQEDITVQGVHVLTFPLGIKESFGSLMQDFGSSRSYYGISWFAEDGTIQYYATAPVSPGEEAKHPNYEKFIIPKGEYATSTIFKWQSKTESIKEVFQQLMAGECPDINRPCIEWYKSDNEMLCMLRMN